MNQEEKIFTDFIRKKNLKQSHQRMDVLNKFLSTDKHLTTEELFKIVKRKNPRIGYATVSRTLKLLCKCGLARELRFHDGVSRFEHLFGHEHHDHLVCVKCGTFMEISDIRIEKLQKEIVKKHQFKELYHRMEIYGICGKCGKKNK
jgi:Fur family ferric uptake transcriptional regulator